MHGLVASLRNSHKAVFVGLLRAITLRSVNKLRVHQLCSSHVAVAKVQARTRRCILLLVLHADLDVSLQVLRRVVLTIGKATTGAYEVTGRHEHVVGADTWRQVSHAVVVLHACILELPNLVEFFERDQLLLEVLLVELLVARVAEDAVVLELFLEDLTNLLRVELTETQHFGGLSGSGLDVDLLMLNNFDSRLEETVLLGVPDNPLLDRDVSARWQFNRRLNVRKISSALLVDDVEVAILIAISH